MSKELKKSKIRPSYQTNIERDINLKKKKKKQKIKVFGLYLALGIFNLLDSI